MKVLMIEYRGLLNYADNVAGIRKILYWVR